MTARRERRASPELVRSVSTESRPTGDCESFCSRPRLDGKGSQFGLSGGCSGVGSWQEDGILMSTAISEPKQRTGTQLNQLEQLKKFTKVVADTADFETMKAFKPQDATTNPSLVLAAIQKQNYAHLLEEVLRNRKNAGLTGAKQIEDICDHLLVQFGTDILKIVPGRVSTETDARLSFDIEGSIAKARHLIELYKEKGIGPERVLIKIASTWEGFLAAEQLQKEGIRCNMKLLFS